MFGLHSRPIISKSLVLGFGQSPQRILKCYKYCTKSIRKEGRRKGGKEGGRERKRERRGALFIGEKDIYIIIGKSFA